MKHNIQSLGRSSKNAKNSYLGMFDLALKNFEKFIEEEKDRDSQEIQRKFAEIA